MVVDGTAFTNDKPEDLIEFLKTFDSWEDFLSRVSFQSLVSVRFSFASPHPNAHQLTIYGTEEPEMQTITAMPWPLASVPQPKKRKT